MTTEREIIYFGLSMRAGFIETGDPLLRAVDAVKMGKPVRALTTDQMKLLIAIEDLMARCLNGGPL